MGIYKFVIAIILFNIVCIWLSFKIYYKKILKEKKNLKILDEQCKNQFCFYRNLLNDDEKLIYNNLLFCIKNKKTTLNLSMVDKILRPILKNKKITLYNELMFIMNCVQLDHPEVFYYYTVVFSNNLFIKFEYSYNNDEINKMQSEIDGVLKKILSKLEDKTENEKIEYVYRYMIKEIGYNDTAKEYSHALPDAYDIYGCMIKKIGVCSGISQTAKFIFDNCGVKSYIIHGYANKNLGKSGHAWLKVFMNNEWKHMDITFDLGKANKSYFAVSDEEMVKKRIWTEDGVVCRNLEEMKEQMQNNIKNSKNDNIIRINKTSL